MKNLLTLLVLSSTIIPLCAAPAISITSTNSRVAITFTGALDAAENITGPWTELTNSSGSISENVTGTRRFYRAREIGGSIFSGTSVLNWTITGPLQTNFNLAYAGTPDGINPPKREKPYFDAQFKMASLELPVTMRVRGNSSLQECSFPKLKMKISKENRTNTPFADAREIKIGTHCAEGGSGNIGRLRDERTAWREALAYETMDLLGFTSPRVRRAIIEYHDTGVPDEFGSSGWTVTRHAFIIDDVEVLAERLGGRALDDDEVSAIRTNPFPAQLLVDLQLLHALFGNWDYGLTPEDQRGIWNTEVIELADKTLLPVAGDFDLASWVTEYVRPAVPSDYHPELTPVERQALYTVEAIRAQAGEDLFATGSARFSQKRSAIEALINAAEVDEAGRTNMLKHVAAFYKALTAMESGGGKR